MQCMRVIYINIGIMSNGGDGKNGLISAVKNGSLQNFTPLVSRFSGECRLSGGWSKTQTKKAVVCLVRFCNSLVVDFVQSSKRSIGCLFWEGSRCFGAVFLLNVVEKFAESFPCFGKIKAIDGRGNLIAMPFLFGIPVSSE